MEQKNIILMGDQRMKTEEEIQRKPISFLTRRRIKKRPKSDIDE